MGLEEVFRKELSPKAYYPVGSDSDVMLYFPREQEEFINGTELLGIRLAINYGMYHFNVNKAQIICFGNNLYGKEVNRIWDEYPDVHIDLVVCSPEAEIIKDSDKIVLKNKINMVEQKGNTKIYPSQIPPTLRSCILYTENEPVLCCVQQYLLSGDNRKPSFTGRETPCIIGCYNGKVFPLEPYVEFCEKEFVRLRKNI